MTFQQQLLIASYNNRIDENELQSSQLNAMINDQNLMAESDDEPSESENEENDEFFEAAIANLDRIMNESDQESDDEERKEGSSDEEYKISNS